METTKRNEWLELFIANIDLALDFLDEPISGNLKDDIEGIDNLCSHFEYDLCGNCQEYLNETDDWECPLERLTPYNNYLKALDDNDSFKAISSLVLLQQELRGLYDKE